MSIFISFHALISEVAPSQPAKPARKQNLMPSSLSGSFKVIYFGVTGKAIVAHFVVVVVAAAAAYDDDDDDDDVECNCDKGRTTSHICDEKTGLCLCEVRFTGPLCEQCSPGYYSFPQCTGMSHRVSHFVSHLWLAWCLTWCLTS